MKWLLALSLFSSFLLQSCTEDALAYSPWKLGSGSNQGWKTPGSAAAAVITCAQTSVTDGTATEHISFADTAGRRPTTAFSIAYWRYVPSLDVSDGVISKSDNSDRSYRIINHPAGGQHMLVYTSGTSNDSANYGQWNTIQAATTWQHFVIVYDGSQASNATRLKVYKNGSAVTATSFGGTIPASLYAGTAAIRIGADNSTTNSFNGNLHNVAIWNSALSAAQAAAVYDFGSDEITTDSANMVLYMRLEGGAPSFPTIPDYSGGGDGTATDMVSGDIVDTQQDIVTGSCQ